MDNIQQLILDTYQAKPRHFTQVLKRNNDVIEYIKLNVPSSITSFLEQLYFAVYRKSNICPNGNLQPLKTFKGYSFCGRTGICACAKASVSASVSSSKQNYTTDRNNKINEKRKLTTLKLYGVANNGQTSKAKEKHREFYNDEMKVANVVSQIKATKLEEYGDENYNNRIKSEKTCLEKYGFKNTWSLTEEKQNPSLCILRDKTQLSSLYPRLSVNEIAETYKLHAQTVYYYLNQHGFREPYKSSFEQEILYFLKELGVTNVITNKRTIIGKELDIFLPDHNLAIEYNGIFWHHDKIQHITKSYHNDKFRLCEEKGIELFTIFSDSWENKKAIWKNKIKSKLGLVKDKVYARNTDIIELLPAETRDILDLHHVQGYCTSQFAYGLKYNDDIVAVMTFSKSRIGIGKDRGLDSFELVRYVTSKNVIGGASKLLKYFIKLHSPKIIVSYSDNQYSVGNLYKTLGFSLEKDNKPGYKYYNPVDKKTYHRFKFAKHNLVKMGYDPKQTEFEITDSMGLLRIWDCGTRTWILNVRPAFSM
jgi:hypothetical protein